MGSDPMIAVLVRNENRDRQREKREPREDELSLK